VTAAAIAGMALIGQMVPNIDDRLSLPGTPGAI
jgi:hypothetical protein